VKKGPPDNDITGEPDEFIESSDMFVGNILTINGFQFILTGADDRTFEYMEDQENRYKVCLILGKTN